MKRKKIETAEIISDLFKDNNAITRQTASDVVLIVKNWSMAVCT
ncbi:MAG TPA: hypothetical protein VHE59_20115 [Mucilaginibacter sp.]|nr:hypothetical protein [Mucilaginibacter sp.]